MKTIISIFFDSTRSLRLLLVFVYALTACALYLRTSSPVGDVAIMFKFMGIWGWEPLCIGLCTSRYIDLFWRLSYPLSRKITAICGIILWSFLFASSFATSQFGLGMLYLAPALIETLLLARACYEHKLGAE